MTNISVTDCYLLKLKTLLTIAVSFYDFHELPSHVLSSYSLIIKDLVQDMKKLIKHL